MSTLKSLRKQIETLQAQEARLVKEAMAGSIAKVKKLMASLGVTLEHLGSNDLDPKKAIRGKAVSGSAKRAGAGRAKYADPKTGATWSGFGRAPAWIAGAKSREKFLVKDATSSERTKASVLKKASAKKATTVARKAITGRSAAANKASRTRPAKSEVSKTEPVSVDQATAPQR